MDFHKLKFTHHATHDHSSCVHAIEDMKKGVEQDEISELFKELDNNARLEAKETGKDVRLPGITNRDLDDELKVGDVPTDDRSRRIWAVLKNVEGAGGGVAELAIADVPAAEAIWLKIQTKKLMNYTYPVSKRLIRGSRPSPQKLSDLFHHNKVKSTINLCREMHHGDDEIIAQAGLTGRMRTLHIPLVDNGQPSPAQVLQFLDYLSDFDNVPAYVHCEQGIGRTGVMVACYRMAFNGWKGNLAKSEAIDQFDNPIPEQQEFMDTFESILLSDDDTNPWTSAFREMGFPRTDPESPTSPPVPARSRQECVDTVHAGMPVPK